MAKTGLERLRDVYNDWGHSHTTLDKWCSIKDWCNDVADQIEREHNDQINQELERRAELSVEARKVVERLREIDVQDCFSAEDCWEGILYALDTDSYDRKEIGTTWSNDMRLTVEKLCDLIEGGHQNLGNPYAMIAEQTTLSEADVRACLAWYQTSQDIINQDIKFKEAADWVQDHGGLDVVKAARETADSIERAYDGMIAWRGELANAVGVRSEGSGGRVKKAIMDAIDKRLMPKGMEWPTNSFGEKLAFGMEFIAPEYGIKDSQKITRICFFSPDHFADGAHGNLCEVNYLRTEDPEYRVKRPKPEVLAADGLPIKAGEILYGTGREQCAYTVIDPISLESCGRFSVEAEDHNNSDEVVILDPSMLTHTKPVFAADGLTIKVGDTVYIDYAHANKAGLDCEESNGECGLYGIEFGQALTVYKINSSDHVGVKLSSWAWCPASWLTHAKPIIGADGLPICEGETVYGQDGMPWTVVHINDGSHPVLGTNGPTERGLKPEWLTHTQPDTQERLYNDAVKVAEHNMKVPEYWGCEGVDCSCCPSKINGKAPDEYYGTPCINAMVLDLLRRQRELKTREGGA